MASEDFSACEDFSKAPQSITELRAARTKSAADWTPRDALVDLLRDIDSGKIKVDALFVCIGAVDDAGNVRSGYRSACASVRETLGIIEDAKFRYIFETQG